MRAIDESRYECLGCGAQLEIPPGAEVTVTIEGRSGRLNQRVIMVGGVEIHRCEMAA
jgi:hypothetical protein